MPIDYCPRSTAAVLISVKETARVISGCNERINSNSNRLVCVYLRTVTKKREEKEKKGKPPTQKGR